jgi:hypothetical protein
MNAGTNRRYVDLTFAKFDSVYSGGQLYDTPRTFSREVLSTWGEGWPEKPVRALDNSGFARKIQAAA